MLLEDHINIPGLNPLIGTNEDEFGPRFPDMSEDYDCGLREKLLAKFGNTDPNLRTGIYMMCSGPSYETPAEIRFFVWLAPTRSRRPLSSQGTAGCAS